MATIQKRKGHYRVLVRVTGHPTVCKTFNSRTEAKRWGERTEDSIRSGTHAGVEAKRTVDEVLPEYLAEMWQRGLKTEDEITRQLEEWRAVLGKYALSQVTAKLIGDHRNKLAKEVAPATVNRKLAALSGFFKWLVKVRQALTVNPVANVPKMKEPRGRVRFLSTDEREKLFAACRAVRAVQAPELYPMVVLACYSGMRQGELLGLTWEDVNLSEGWASLHDTKNGTSRTVPIAGLALTALQEWNHAAGVVRIGKARVFPSKWFPKKAWDRALTAAEVDGFRFHDLRHTAASYLVQSGAGLADVAAILGHKMLSMTQRYAHLSPERVQTVMGRMMDQFS